ncbi:hypothetical protein C2869_05890 [Saccharobesus litoralis]|uniref:mannan endo-1,4-beta-mannosidase n=1 Tax=Saccharobesus litoralis TaxID=2172099 RepID=A0A2S0VP50_9ALTE|nr:CBM35 domain-containing protein [Saccharobesus litoralis]AWB65997.1 hypothetical protein C2869_05890 [Saccharobesus litoralis]
MFKTKLSTLTTSVVALALLGTTHAKAGEVYPTSVQYDLNTQQDIQVDLIPDPGTGFWYLKDVNSYSNYQGVLTINSDFLQTLSAGEHDFEVYFSDGSYDVLTVAVSDGSNNSGGNGNTGNDTGDTGSGQDSGSDSGNSGSDNTGTDASNTSLVLTIDQANLSDGANLASDHINLNKGLAQWSYNAPTSGQYQIDVIYQSPYGSKVNNFYVNDNVQSVTTAQTSSDASYRFTLELAAGNNTIGVDARNQWGYIWLRGVNIIAPADSDSSTGDNGTGDNGTGGDNSNYPGSYVTDSTKDNFADFADTIPSVASNQYIVQTDQTQVFGDYGDLYDGALFDKGLGQDVGIAWAGWNPYHYEANKATKMAVIDEYNIKRVSFIPTYFISTYAEGIRCHDDNNTLSAAKQASLIKELIDKGVRVNYRPHIDPIQFSWLGANGNENPGSLNWRGLFDQLDPMADDYKCVIDKGLAIIEDVLNQVNLPLAEPIRYDIGAELMESTKNYPARWVELLAYVRAQVAANPTLANNVFFSHNFSHHIQYLMELENHPEYFSRIVSGSSFQQYQHLLFLDDMTDQQRADIANYIKALDTVTVSQYMPMDILNPVTDNNSTSIPTTPSDVKDALQIHEQNFLQKVLMGKLGIAKDDLPPFHLGEYGMGVKGLVTPNVWDRDEVTAAELVSYEAHQKHAEVAIKGLLEYMQDPNTVAKSLMIWVSGAPYDVIGFYNGDGVGLDVGDAEHGYPGQSPFNVEAAAALKDYWTANSNNPQDPIDPIDPIDPTDPTDPTDPVDPNDPVIPPLSTTTLTIADAVDSSVTVQPVTIEADYIQIENSQVGSSAGWDFTVETAGQYRITLNVENVNGDNRVNQAFLNGTVKDFTVSSTAQIVFDAELEAGSHSTGIRVANTSTHWGYVQLKSATVEHLGSLSISSPTSGAQLPSGQDIVVHFDKLGNGDITYSINSGAQQTYSGASPLVIPVTNEGFYRISLGLQGTSTTQSIGVTVGELTTGSFVTTNGTQFMLDGKPWYFNGTNQYYLMYKPEPMAQDFFNRAEAVGLNAVRTWMFCNDEKTHDGVCINLQSGNSFVLSKAPSERTAAEQAFIDRSFELFDNYVALAAEKNIRLVLSLADEWDYFGRITDYGPYTDMTGRAQFKAFITNLLNHTNQITGIAYKDDPTIMMWELANEPRIANGFADWVDDIASHIKSIAPQHLVSIGMESSFNFNSSGDDYQTLKSLNANPNIDAVSAHIYPTWWNMTDAQTVNNFELLAQLGRELNKPTYIGEFSWPANVIRPVGQEDSAAYTTGTIEAGLAKRTQVFTDWYAVAWNNKDAIGGMLSWQLSGLEWGNGSTGGQWGSGPYGEYSGGWSANNDGFQFYCVINDNEYNITGLGAPGNNVEGNTIHLNLHKPVCDLIKQYSADYRALFE